MKRRHFLKSTAAGLTVLPSGTLFGQNAPSDKLNIALIGVGGRGTAHYKVLQSENVVALCDINANNMKGGEELWPRAKTYVDWRKCLDQKDIDAVVICTTDHTHAFVANWALNRGKHVYCEKPLGITVEEVRTVRANYVRQRNKVATQHGTQRHANPNFNRVRELIQDGAVGELHTVSAWGNRQLRRKGYHPQEGEPPAHIAYDLWLGPSPEHPYNPAYFSGRPGGNCLQWNMFWDFGVGQIGDMGAHTLDLAWNAIDTDLPTSAHTDMEASEKYNPEVTPVELKCTYDNPANKWRPAIKVVWYQGGPMPESPRPYIDIKKIGHGAMFEGTKGTLLADFRGRVLLPNDDDGDLTYYKGRSKAATLPNLNNKPPQRRGDTRFQQEWLDACKGDLKTSCDFVYGGNLIEQMLLALVSYRAGAKIEYDPKAGRITNIADANQYLKREYRQGWTLNG